MRLTYIGLAFLLVGVLAVCLFIFPAGAAGQGKTLEERVAALERKINGTGATVPQLAVADLEKLVNDCPTMQGLRKSLIQYRDAESAKLETLKASIEGNRRKQQNAPQDSEEWWKWEEIIRSEQIEYDARNKYLAQSLLNMEMKNVETVYKEIISAVEKYAGAKGYTIVLWKPPVISDEVWEMARKQGNPLQHRYMIDVRPILYCSEKAVDITDDLLKTLQKKSP